MDGLLRLREERIEELGKPEEPAGCDGRRWLRERGCRVYIYV